jgi:predicted HD superfamily hydrolase involved in NAD metabolism
MQTAVVLARIHGLNPWRAAIAGLLHDCAKSLERNELFDISKDQRIPPEFRHPDFGQLLHAPAGAIIAVEMYHVNDSEVLEAIAWHPTGRKAPSGTLMALIAADYCEPSRDFPGVGRIRSLVRENLREGVVEILRNKSEHVRASGRQVHASAGEALESLNTGFTDT